MGPKWEVELPRDRLEEDAQPSAAELWFSGILLID